MTEILKTVSKCGYSPKDLVSHVFTGCPLIYNISPKEVPDETDEKKLEIFFAIAKFNFYLSSVEKKILVVTIKFPENFKKSIENPTEKTKKAADFYPDWFKICCHLKYLLEEDGLHFFKLFSSLSEKYNEKECEKFWKNCRPKYGSIPGVFSIIEKYKVPEAKIPNRRELIKKSFF